jgi:hypothetical protein
MVTMRWLALLGLLAACGRVGFDAHGETADDAMPDALGDAGDTAALCDDHVIGELGEPATKLRAAQVAAGWVVAADTADYIAFGRVQPDGTTGGIYKDLALSATYTLQGIGVLHDEVGLTVSETSTAQSYLKKEHPSLDSHDTSVAWDLGIEADPAYAPMPSGHGLLACSFSGFLGFKEIDAGNIESDFLSTYAPQGMRAMHVAAIGAGYAVLLEMPAGTCEAYVMDGSGATTNHRTFACTDASIVSTRDGRAYAVYDDDGATHLVDIPYTAGTMVSPAYPDHRVSVATATWVASSPSPGVVEVYAMPDPRRVAMVAGTAFDIVGDELFWADGMTLHAGRLCLQPK